ncbi:MAG: hypothetical protein E6G44_09735 [Actinobacteria bacterium]|nr:MAG: hypothetical protein E6G44_09735 [Actinomycetota bacterium]
MAQPMHCDYAGCPNLGDWIVSRVDNGDTFAWCQEHYVLLCRATVEQANQAELEAQQQAAQADQLGQQLASELGIAEPEPALNLAAVPDTEPDDDEDDDEDAVVRRLQATGRPTPEQWAAAEAQDLGELTPATAAALEAPRSTRVVKRGTSPSRRAHEARKRVKAAPPPDEPDLSSAAAEGD